MLTKQVALFVFRSDYRSDKQKIAEAFRVGNVEGLIFELAPTYNAAPQSMQPAIVWGPAGGTRMLQMMFWRFLPPRATDPKTFNLDTITQGPNRCSKAICGVPPSCKADVWSRSTPLSSGSGLTQRPNSPGCSL
jgi:hypothetical protein